jgi:nucleotide-binding universal stress UspA family protein
MTALASRTNRDPASLADPTRDAERSRSHVKKLILATDLTEASASATDEAFELAGRLGASLLVVSVIDPGSLLMPGGRFRVRVDQVRERREVLAQELVERGRMAGIDVSFLIWTGDPGDMIVEAAEAEHADMVLVGSHGRGAVGRLFLGSVSEHVVRNARCPVLVVRPRETPVN